MNRGQLVGVTPDDVVALAACLFDIDEDELRGHSLRRRIVALRYVTMAACHLATMFSHDEIGEAFDGRTREVVRDAIRRVDANPELFRIAVLITEDVQDAHLLKMGAAS